MLLSEFDIQYVNRKEIKGQEIVDCLANAPLVIAYPLFMESLDEYICVIEEQPRWNLYFDGSYTSHGSRAGILLVTPQGDYIPKVFQNSISKPSSTLKFETKFGFEIQSSKFDIMLWFEFSNSLIGSIMQIQSK